MPPRPLCVSRHKNRKLWCGTSKHSSGDTPRLPVELCLRGHDRAVRAESYEVDAAVLAVVNSKARTPYAVNATKQLH